MPAAAGEAPTAPSPRLVGDDAPIPRRGIPTGSSSGLELTLHPESSPFGRGKEGGEAKSASLPTTASMVMLATASDKGFSADEMWRDARFARQQLDAKRADLVTAMQALQQTEHALREVVQDRQEKYSEIRILKHQVSSSEAREQDMKQRLQAVESEARSWEERAQAASHRVREAESRCDELEARLAAVEAERRAAERHADGLLAAVSEQAREAAESEHQCELRAAEAVEETRRSLVELDRKRESEMRTALEELRNVGEIQQSLRSELRSSTRPPRFSSEDSLSYEEPCVSSPYPSQKVWNAACEIARGRPRTPAWSSSVSRGLDHEPVQRLPHQSGGGSLLEGRVRAQADLILAQASAMQSRRLVAGR